MFALLVEFGLGVKWVSDGVCVLMGWYLLRGRIIQNIFHYIFHYLVFLRPGVTFLSGTATMVRCRVHIFLVRVSGERTYCSLHITPLVRPFQG